MKWLTRDCRHRLGILPALPLLPTTMAVAIVCASTCISVHAGQVRPAFPPDPAAPTAQDCIDLDKQYFRIRKDVSDRLFACWRSSPVNLGQAAGCHGTRQYYFQVNCSGIDVQLCEIDDRRRAAVTTCRDRISSHTQDSGEDKAAAPNHERTMTERFRRANDVTDFARSLSTGLQDPKTFFIDALGSKAPVLKDIFRSADYRSSSVDADLAGQLFQFAHNFALGSVQMTPSSGIKRIQEEILKQLGERQKSIYIAIGELGAVLQDFANTSYPSVEVSRRFSGFLRVPERTHDADCHVLRNDDASRELNDRDPSRWLALVKRCTG